MTTGDAVVASPDCICRLPLLHTAAFEEGGVVGYEKPKVRIIRMRKVPFIDSTGIHNLQNLIEMNHEEGIHVILSGVNPKVHSQLQKARFYDLMESDHICPHIDVALAKAREFLGE